MKLFPQYKEFSAYPFPEHSIDPKIKIEKDWCIRFAKAIYSRYVSDRAGVLYSDLEKFSDLRAYGHGNQSIDKYETYFGSKKQEGEKASKSFININKDIFSPAPKFKGYLRQRYKDLTAKPKVKSVDKLASLEKKDKEAQSMFFMNEGPWVEAVESKIGKTLDRPEFIPSSAEELEAFKQTVGFKSKAEIAYTFAITYTELISRFPDIADKMIDDISDLNICCAKNYVSKEDGKVYVKYIDPARAIGFYSLNDNFTKSPAFGHFEDYTLQSVLQETNLNEEEIKEICMQYSGYQGNANFNLGGIQDIQYDNGKWGVDDTRVLVLECEFLSVDSKYIVKHTTKNNSIRYYDDEYGKVRDTQSKKTLVNPVQRWYKCKWLVGTEHIWDYGLATDVPRPNKARPRSSYQMLKIPGKSFMESIIVPLDQIQLAHIKMENALAKAAPNGLAIEYGSLENIDLGDGSLKPIELLRLRNIQGNLIYKATTHRGHFSGTAAKPVMELQGGAGSMLQEAIQMMELNFNLIAEITGIDRHSIGVLPSGETSATASATAASGTGLIIMNMAQALNRVREEIALSVVHQIALRVRHSKEIYNIYHPALGTANLEILKLSAEMTPDEMGIEMKVVPNDVDKKDIHEAALASLRQKESGAPGIEYPDYLFIKEQINEGNIAYARAFLEMKQNKALAKYEEQNLAKIKAQADGNSETAERTSAAQMKADKAKADLDISVMKATEQEKRITNRELEEERRKTALAVSDEESERLVGGKLIDNELTEREAEQPVMQ
jgi:hypothetical protein